MLTATKSTFAGHPLHAQLVTLPTGLMPFSLAMDVMHLVTRRKGFADAAYSSLVGGLAAAVAGATDYLAIPNKIPAKRIANTHAILNIGLMAVQTLNLLARRKKPSTFFGTLLNAAANAGLWVSAWYGGDLVYQHGIRVQKAQPLEEVPTTKLKNDDAIAERLDQWAQSMPESGPIVQSTQQLQHAQQEQ